MFSFAKFSALGQPPLALPHCLTSALNDSRQDPSTCQGHKPLK